MLDQEEGAKRVDFKGLGRVLPGDGRERFFWMQDAGNTKGEPQRSGWETGFAMRRGGRDSGFVCQR